jgi:hypothetical protein
MIKLDAPRDRDWRHSRADVATFMDMIGALTERGDVGGAGPGKAACCAGGACWGGDRRGGLSDGAGW